MGHNAIETVLGGVVLAVAGLFMTFAYSTSNLQSVPGYRISARFPMVDGLKEGTDVKVNGVKVGSVVTQRLLTEPGPNQYLVDVQMSLRPDVVLPADTMALIASEGLLGGKYMALEVGVEEDNIKTDGTGRITRTQAPMRLDDLIGQLIYNSKKGGEEKAAPAPAAEAPATAPVPAPTAPAGPEATAPPPASSVPSLAVPAVPVTPAAPVPGAPPAAPAGGAHPTMGTLP